MNFTFSENTDKIIAEYNEKMKQEGTIDFGSFTRRMLMEVKCNGKLDNRERSNGLFCVLDKIHFIEVLRNWLRRQCLDYVSLDAIQCVLISTEILGVDSSMYNGFAQKAGSVYYIYVELGESVERTISILTHEIVHVEMDIFFRRYEEVYCNEIDKILEEETVIFLEHYILEKLFDINRNDISMEERCCYENEFCLCIDENCLKESLNRWIKKRQEARRIEEHKGQCYV